MSYSHNQALVSKIEKITERVAIECAETKKRHEDSGRDPVFDVGMYAESGGVPVEFNGFLINTKLKEFIDTFDKQGIYKYGVTYECPNVWGNGYTTYCDVWVYREGDEYAMGRIGFVNTRIKKTEYRYSVYSRTITNSKAAPHRWQYNSKSTDKLEMAVKLANKHLRIYSPVEVARISFDGFQAHVKQSVNSARNTMYQAIRDTKEDLSLIEELVRIADSGYHFSKVEIGERIMRYKEAHETYKDELTRTKPAYFVQMGLVGGEQIWNVVEHGDVKNGTSDAMQSVNKQYKTDDLPEDILGKLAVLNMIDVSAFVEGVGYRAGHFAYWLERDHVPEMVS